LHEHVAGDRVGSENAQDAAHLPTRPIAQALGDAHRPIVEAVARRREADAAPQDPAAAAVAAGISLQAPGPLVVAPPLLLALAVLAIPFPLLSLSVLPLAPLTIVPVPVALLAFPLILLAVLALALLVLTVLALTLLSLARFPLPLLALAVLALAVLAITVLAITVLAITVLALALLTRASLLLLALATLPLAPLAFPLLPLGAAGRIVLPLALALLALGAAGWIVAVALLTLLASLAPILVRLGQLHEACPARCPGAGREDWRSSDQGRDRHRGAESECQREPAATFEAEHRPESHPCSARSWRDPA